MTDTPAPSPTAIKYYSRRHPPYEEMITRAISALDETSGSTHTAIANFISTTYSNLPDPDAHDVLLSSHIIRLKKEGFLKTVVYYQLTKPPPRPRGRPPFKKPNNPQISEKRKPGRPPFKISSSRELLLPPSLNPSSVPVELSPLATKRKPGRPFKVRRSTHSNDVHLVAAPPPPPPPSTAKRRPGRPPKLSLPPPALSPLATQRKPGRPPKVRPSTHSNDVAASPSAAKRKRGRPRKNSASSPVSPTTSNHSPNPVAEPTTNHIPIPVAEPTTNHSPIPVAEPALPSEKRKRGRPLKVAQPSTVPNHVSVAAATDPPPTESRKRGRPRKNMASSEMDSSSSSSSSSTSMGSSAEAVLILPRHIQLSNNRAMEAAQDNGGDSQ